MAEELTSHGYRTGQIHIQQLLSYPSYFCSNSSESHALYLQYYCLCSTLKAIFIVTTGSALLCPANIISYPCYHSLCWKALVVALSSAHNCQRWKIPRVDNTSNHIFSQILAQLILKTENIKKGFEIRTIQGMY